MKELLFSLVALWSKNLEKKKEQTKKKYTQSDRRKCHRSSPFFYCFCSKWRFSYFFSLKQYQTIEHILQVIQPKIYWLIVHQKSFKKKKYKSMMIYYKSKWKYTKLENNEWRKKKRRKLIFIFLFSFRFENWFYNGVTCVRWVVRGWKWLNNV